MTDLGFDYVPCDISSDILGRYHDPHAGRTLVSYWEALPLKDRSCDLILALDVIEHLPDPRTAIAETARVLRPGGAVLIKTPNPLGAVLPLFAPFADPTHWTVLPKERWERAFQDAGFTIDRPELHSLFPCSGDGIDVWLHHYRCQGTAQISSSLPWRGR